MRRLGMLLIFFAACSSSPSPAPTKPEPTKPAARCTDGVVGGWDGTPECKATAATPVPGTDRVCATNADCIRIGPHCAPLAIRSDRTEAYPSTACTPPNAGQCPPPCAAVCRDGCCAIPDGWGDNCR